MEKYKSYSTEEAQEQRIDLHKNFRSREQVLESVNFIFRQIMGEDLGGITYDKDAALYPGASFPEGESEEFVKTEVLLVERDGEELSDVQDYEDAGASGNRREMENQTATHRGTIRDIPRAVASTLHRELKKLWEKNRS